MHKYLANLISSHLISGLSGWEHASADGVARVQQLKQHPGGHRAPPCCGGAGRGAAQDEEEEERLPRRRPRELLGPGMP